MKNDSDILDNFCSSLDVSSLKHLSSETRDVLVKFAQKGAKTGEKKHVARKILQYYNLLETPAREEKYPRDRAEAVLSQFSVGITGARPGDILFGRSGINKGAIIKIHHQPVYPQRKDLVYLQDYPDLWEAYLVKLGSIPFFAEMSRDARAEWVLLNADPTEISIGEGEERIEMLQPGTADFIEKLTEAQVDELMSRPEHWSSAEIEAMFPAKPGSKARKHTLILLRNMWSVSIDYSVARVYNGLTVVLNADGVRVVPSTVAGEGEIVYLLDDVTKKLEQKKDGKWVRPPGKSSVQKIGIQVVNDPFPKSDAALTELIRELWPSATRDDISRIRSNMREYTGAAYKSLLQKLIRFRAKQVEMLDGELFPTELVLLVTLAELYKYAGSFVPDIQRYVSGLESLTKRLAIAILEDASVRDPEKVFSLMSGALLAQRVRTWLPDRALLKRWFTTALEALESSDAYDYNIPAGLSAKPFVLDVHGDHYQNLSAILDELRSFAGDLALVRDIAYQSREKFVSARGARLERMPMIHVVDQHWLTTVALFYENIPKSPPATPFSKLFENLFKRVTGYNPRRTSNFSESDPFTMETRRAQMLTLLAKQTEQVPRDFSSSETETITYTLDTGWLAAMVGAIEIKGTLVTLNITDPTQLIVIRRPSREMTSNELTPEREAEAIRVARELLSRGVPLNTVPSPEFIGGKAVLRGGEEYYIRTRQGREIPWDLARRLTTTVPVISNPVEFNPVKALIHTSPGITRRSELEKLLTATPASVLFRVLSYITHFRNTVEINKISRDGGGTGHSVVPEDAAAFRFLLELSWICPGALKPTELTPGRFDVVSNVVFWSIRDSIRAHIVSLNDTAHKDGWGDIYDRKNRQLWRHQQESLNDMTGQFLGGSRGNFLWLPVGLGKTAVVMSFLKELLARKKLPDYVIYTLPESAIKSVLNEIQTFGFSVELLVPVKSADIKIPSGVSVSRTCTAIKPNTVTLIEHDYLRRCEGELLAVAPRAIFIIDEVHKALNDTKRTSVALEISRLANQFIALTGTPVIDSNTYKLLWWLEQVVNFQVNERNFWVAANSMVAKRANTGILVDYGQVLAQFTAEESAEYRSYVPPALGGENRSPTNMDWTAASEVSYRACDREIVKQTLEFIARGRGVMLVAKDTAHQQRLSELLFGKGVSSEKVFLLRAGDSIFLTDEAVREGKVPDYKVVIVPIRKAEGYTLTRLSVMISSVYPSNNATREQIEGRINRIGQAQPQVIYRIVHAGLLTRILQHHNDAKSLSLALQSLAAEIN